MVPAALYLEHFASDRTHMLEAGSQIAYQKPPPQYACIVSPRETPLMHLSLFVPARTVQAARIDLGSFLSIPPSIS